MKRRAVGADRGALNDARGNCTRTSSGNVRPPSSAGQPRVSPLYNGWWCAVVRQLITGDGDFYSCAAADSAAAAAVRVSHLRLIRRHLHIFTTFCAANDAIVNRFLTEHPVYSSMSL